MVPVVDLAVHSLAVCLSVGSEVSAATQPSSTPSAAAAVSAFQGRQLAPPSFASTPRDLYSVPIVTTASYVMAGNVLPSKLLPIRHSWLSLYSSAFSIPFVSFNWRDKLCESL